MKQFSVGCTLKLASNLSRKSQMLSIQVMHDTLFDFFFSPQVNLKSALNDSVKVARWMFCKLIPLWIVRNL